MPAQPLVAEVSCRCTPVYVDMDGRLYVGREMTKTQKIEIPNTAITGPSSTNLCKTKTSKFGYTLPPFGCNNTYSPIDSAANAESTETSEDRTTLIKNAISFPVYARGLFVDMLNVVPRRLSSLFGLTALPILPAMITLDIASGRDPWRATKANVGGFAAGYKASNVVGTLVKNAARVRFAGRTAMMGARAGNVAGALVGFVAGIIAYEVAYSIIDKIPDSSDRAFYGYDDFFSDPYER